MENRFGFKDFVLVTLVIVLILVVYLGMKQLDRQWAVLQTMSQRSDEQTHLLASIDRNLNDALNAGGSVVARPPSTEPATTEPTAPGTANAPTVTSARYPHGDPFLNMKEAEKKPDFVRGDWIIDNFGAKLKTITYPIASDLYAAWVAARVQEGLIYRDPMTLEYRPQLARDFQVSDDGLTYTFQLRKGVRFSDGEPFTADDVLYSYQLVMNPKVACPRLKGYFDKIKTVEKKGEDEIVFTMTEPYFESLDLCGTMTIVPKHFYEKFDEQEINTNPGLLMGTGPYRMPDPKGWRPGQKVELVRNELYWGSAPTFDRCVFLEVENETAEETMFGNGALDVYAVPPAAYQRLLNDGKTKLHANNYETESPMNGYAYIAWNQKKKKENTIFSDPRVRRAMTMLTDRNRICREVFLDYAKPTSGPFAMTSPQADPSITSWPFDVVAAKQLLEEAGFKDRDGSGVLTNDAGTPLQFKLTYGNNNATFDRVVLFLKDTYAKAGVTLVQDPVDWPILQKKLDDRDFDAISLSWGGALESDLYQEFDSSQMSDQGDNFMSYENPKFDAVVREARRTVDVPRRMALWHQAHAILHQDQPYTFSSAG